MLRSMRENNDGFTLIELVAVIVLLGIVALGSTQFIRQSTEIYVDAATRDRLQQQARFAIERMTRELRNALPGSVRVDASGQCIEFLSIRRASSYLSPVSDTAISSLNIIVVDGGFVVGDRIAILPLETTSVYSSDSTVSPLATLTSVTAPALDQQTLGFAAKRFPDESSSRRIFVAEGPISFCAADNLLTRHSGYGLSPAQVVPPAGGVPLAENIRLVDRDGNALNVFEFTNGTLQRAAVVKMDLAFSARATLGQEWLAFRHEVTVRNTP